MTVSGSDWSDTLSYTYDCKGNIETISENGTQKAKYYYDELNQLIREDNTWRGKTVAFNYDNGGNILSVSEYAITSASDISSLEVLTTNTYTYSDANWKDKLTSFNGNAITYDEIGNPLTYYDGKAFTWQNGRQLVGVSATDLDISYTYNSDGIRTSKTINGVTTTYTLEGSNIVKETNGTDTIWYYYDASGSLTGFEFNDTPYFYVKNVQGDITAITDANGNIVVEYVYDSWGKHISTTGSLASTVGVKNPFRYRGYYYDTETSFYYLNSRYYDPITKRFINADEYVTTGTGVLGNNMFAYCINNPVSMIDSLGTVPLYVVTDVETEIIGTTDNGVLYKTTITYNYVDIGNPFFSFSSSASFTYSISNNGIVSFDNSQTNAHMVLDSTISHAIANEMRSHARKQVPNALDGRTLSGIAFELYAHYLGKIAGINPGNTNTTEIGSNIKGSIGYDYNADWFEHPIENAFEIIKALF